MLRHILSRKRSTSTGAYAPMALHHAPARRVIPLNPAGGRRPPVHLPGVRPIHFAYVTVFVEGRTKSLSCQGELLAFEAPRSFAAGSFNTKWIGRPERAPHAPPVRAGASHSSAKGGACAAYAAQPGQRRLGAGRTRREGTIT